MLEENIDDLVHNLEMGKNFRHDVNLEDINENNNKFEIIKNFKFPYGKNTVNKTEDNICRETSLIYLINKSNFI